MTEYVVKSVGQMKQQKQTGVSVMSEQVVVDGNNVIRVDFTKPPQPIPGDTKVLLRDVWQQLSPAKGNSFLNWARDNVESQRFKKGNDYGFLPTSSKNRGRPKTEYWVTVDTAKMICMMSRCQKGDDVRAYFIECEKLVWSNGLQDQITSIPDLANPDVFLQLAQNYKQACMERDEAIRTKAQISDTKTATALANSGVKTKQIKKLETELHETKLELDSHYRAMHVVKKLKSKKK
ncbi:MAG: antA/AntB antirepressor family protein [Oligoflexus sp.]